MRTLYHKLRWILRKVIWKHWHVDPLEYFQPVNDAETAIWVKTNQIVEQINFNSHNNSKCYSKISKILELGCANGRNLINAKKSFGSTYKDVRLAGVDINRRAISLGRDRIMAESLKGIQLENADVSKVDFENVDIIISIATLLYLDFREVSVLLKKIADSEVKFFVFFEPLSEGASFLGGHNYYHSLEAFDVLKDGFSLYELELKNSGWEIITGVSSKAIIWSSKENDVKLKF